MIGTVTEDLKIKYEVDSYIYSVGPYIDADITYKEIPIPESDHAYAKDFIGKQVEFVIWEGGRDGEEPPIAWIQHKEPKITVAVPFKERIVIFDNVTREQKEVLDLYHQLLTSQPRRGTTGLGEYY